MRTTRREFNRLALGALIGVTFGIAKDQSTYANSIVEYSGNLTAYTHARRWDNTLALDAIFYRMGLQRKLVNYENPEVRLTDEAIIQKIIDAQSIDELRDDARLIHNPKQLDIFLRKHP